MTPLSFALTMRQPTGRVVRLFKKIDSKCSFSLLRADKQVAVAVHFLPDTSLHGPSSNQQ